MHMNLWQWNVAAWYAGGLYWLVSAFSAKRARVVEKGSGRLVHALIMAAAFYLIFARWLGVGILGRRFVPQSRVLQELGVFLTYLGVAIAIWARYHIGQYWSGRVGLKHDHKLITSGPYAHVRHPIYTGLLLALAGTALLIGEWRCIVGVIMATFELSRKAAKEEALLSGEFGEEFQNYRRHTGFLVPRLG